jgi:heterodisulfide reductase subunit C
MDYTPPQILHAIQLGLSDLVFKSKTIWLCASCQTCTTRCPQDVDIAAVMDAVRILAQRQKIKAKVPEIPIFNQSALYSIRLFGRMYDLGLMAAFKVSTRSFTKDVGLGLEMLKKGKLNLLPSFNGASSARRIFSQVKRREKSRGKI